MFSPVNGDGFGGVEIMHEVMRIFEEHFRDRAYYMTWPSVTGAGEEDL